MTHAAPHDDAMIDANEIVSDDSPELEQDLMRELESGARGARFRERRDVVSKEVKDEAHLVRFVIGPEKSVVPDISAKLPGRGIWVAADRDSVTTAAQKGLFARSAKTQAKAPADLADQVETLLARSVLGLLGMAQRSGKLESGFDKVRGLIAVEPPAFRIAALDAARDGRNKIRMASKAAWNATPIVACFSSAQLGAALGREDITHAAVREGKLANKLAVELGRLAGFRDLIPSDWETELEDAKLAAQLRAPDDA